jgi:hypothetical protein
MSKIKDVIFKVLFAVLLGFAPTWVMAQSTGASGAVGTWYAPGVNGINDTRNIIPGSPRPGTFDGIYGESTGNNQGDNSTVSPQNEAVTPGGLETTPGEVGANISNTPSNITPATTPPLQ